MENKPKFSTEAEMIAYKQGLDRGISKGRRQAASESQLKVNEKIEKIKHDMMENNSAYIKGYNEGFIAGENHIKQLFREILGVD
jgi:hypothetical protein|nr:MAG TPA: hypothetical protein [Caudoviricetes sp.]DAO60908.1 MAG TPA: hypothetical protein [Herelleviridae sp.]